MIKFVFCLLFVFVILLASCGTTVEEMKSKKPTPTIEQTPVATLEPTKSLPIFYLSEDEGYVGCSIVAGESGNQIYEGKVAVTNCILNACMKDGLQPSEVRTVYQYGGWYDIDQYSIDNPESAEEVKAAVKQIFYEGNLFSDTILWFYNPKYSSGKFHNTQQFIFEIGDHRFYAPWN